MSGVGYRKTASTGCSMAAIRVPATRAASKAEVCLGSILDLQCLEARSVLPTGRNRPRAVVPMLLRFDQIGFTVAREMRLYLFGHAGR